MKLLLVRVGALGDVLHALPAAAALKRLQPATRIDWVIDERWRPLVTAADEPGPLVTRSFPVPTRQWKAAPFSRATLASFTAFRSLRGHYDHVVDLQGTLRSAALGRLAAAPGQLSGYADPRESFAARLYAHSIPRRGTHIVDMTTNLLADSLGLNLLPAPIRLPRLEQAERWAEHDAVLRRPLALLAPSAGWGSKRWPAASFGALARLLHQRGYDVVVNAAHAQDADANAVLAHSHATARLVVCDIAGMVALMRRVDLMIGPDSGPTHLAAMLAVPTVALFGPTSPERNGPWGPGPKIVLRHPGSPTTYKRSAEPDPGLSRILPEEVLEAVETLRNGGSSPA
ncbi:MAG: glycosyltransferase family 9 protein [Acidobacteriaceae bacterium]|nr:glycosyltransferase family 9 protein [Acidobacteriaceae bacterium]